MRSLISRISILFIIFAIAIFGGCGEKAGPVSPSTNNKATNPSDLPPGQEGIMDDER